MFDVDEFVGKCKRALKTDNPPATVAELMNEALADCVGLAQAFNHDDGQMIHFLHCSEDLTVAHMGSAPGAVSPIHNHRMWGVIGVYAGQEDNYIYRRQGDGLAMQETKSLRAGDMFVMDPELIHYIENPLRDPNGTIHVYGGDLRDRPGRSLWDPDTQEEMPYSYDRVIQFMERVSAQKSA